MIKNLPYDFDLLYDIKSEEQLVSQYLYHKTTAASIECVCKEHNIDIVVLVNHFKKK